MLAVLVHGWGYSESLWDPLLPGLSRQFTLRIVDKGYFKKSPTRPARIQDPWIGIGHSQGFSELSRLFIKNEKCPYLANKSIEYCAGLIGISGFINFPGIENKQGYINAQLRSMLFKLSTKPRQVVEDFWKQSGDYQPNKTFSYMNVARLQTDLRKLLLPIHIHKGFHFPVVNILSKRDKILLEGEKLKSPLNIETVYINGRSHVWMLEDRALFHFQIQRILQSWNII